MAETKSGWSDLSKSQLYISGSSNYENFHSVRQTDINFATATSKFLWPDM